ncbi:MAG: hypothetical protein JSR19_11920 [Proteobacteria bacterium]|nr:hypothetical protein [Pseudomonadota bacterium]HQR04560.1 hypothetical protein [Rhodocyclaceae bacterium]
MTPDALLDLLREIEVEDPIDYADLPFDEDALRALACTNVTELLASDSYQGLDQNDRELMAAATITRLVLENLVLNARLLRAR